jgi:hypothetical protein
MQLFSHHYTTKCYVTQNDLGSLLFDAEEEIFYDYAYSFVDCQLHGKSENGSGKCLWILLHIKNKKYLARYQE